MDKNTKRVRLGCYSCNITMSAVGNLSPLLFLTFRDLYNLSYTLLGSFVLINFATQLTIDLLFSFFSHKFNISKSIKLAPVLAIIGFFVYAMAPFAFRGHEYFGIALGTIIFSSASGLNEVLISPVIAALPSDNPERDMSKLHSSYAWGVVGVVLFTTLFLLLFGHKWWFILPLLYILIPLFSTVMFFNATLPPLDTPEKTSGAISMLKNKTLLLCVLAIFLGGACEVIMAQWCSSYAEQSLGLPKVWGDVFGAAMFAVMLGLGRTLYAKYGKNIEKVLFLCGLGSVLCYATCILSPIPLLGLIACALTGFCVSMMWPGSLVVSTKRIATGGVFIYALMAAGGDFGAAVGPQLMGIITDAVTALPAATTWATKLGLTIEQLGMKLGMCIGLLCAIAAMLVFLRIWRTKNKYEEK